MACGHGRKWMIVSSDGTTVWCLVYAGQYGWLPFDHWDNRIQYHSLSVARKKAAIIGGKVFYSQPKMPSYKVPF